LREAFGIPESTGAVITEVHDDGPAARAGLSAADVTAKMDKRSIHGIDDVRRVLDYFEPGERLSVENTRDKEKQQLELTLGDRTSRRLPGRSE
jgi:serine protease Do